ncbi:MAG TPA: Rrf2 family transcriptional regulator [bacterium]|nr:Rrf2 family transcriptional regulator [bacterium]
MARIWKISEGAALAVHAVVLLAAAGERILTTGEMARRLEASEAHLNKVLQRLAKGGLVKGSRGPRGGFRLNRPADEITLLTVYELIEGPIESGACAFGVPVCGGKRCVLGGLMETMANQAREYLGQTRVSEMADIFSGINRECVAGPGQGKRPRAGRPRSL